MSLNTNWILKMLRENMDIEKFEMPLPLEKITQNIFESLSEKKAAQFFADIPDAIGVDGKDLSLVHWQFLRDTLLRLPEITEEIQTVVDGMSLLAEGKKWSNDEARAANAAAVAKARATFYATRHSAYAAAYAANAAYADASAAAIAALYAVYGPYAAARAAAGSSVAERNKQAQSIIKLLKDAPIGEANAD